MEYPSEYSEEKAPILDTFQIFSVEQRSSKTISVLWKTPYQSSKQVGYTDVVCQVWSESGKTERNSHVGWDNWSQAPVHTEAGNGRTSTINELTLSYEFQPGNTYMISLNLQGEGFHILTDWVTVEPMEITFVKDYGKKDLAGLLDRCKNWMRDNGGEEAMEPIQTVYRNKPGDYFEQIKQYRQGLMEVLPVNNSGHPGNPINGKLNGLFFSASNKLSQDSPFGEVRLTVKVEALLHKDANLYFADFYCADGEHYITLVIARKYTDSDSFCRKQLVQLDIGNNPFLQEVSGYIGDEIYISRNTNVQFEVLYTENLDFKELHKFGMQIEGTKQAKPGTYWGNNNNKFCPACKM